MVFQPLVLLPEVLFSFSERIGLTRRLHPAIDLTLDQRRVVQQPDNFFPDEFIQVVLANGSVPTYRSLQMPISIRTDTSVVVQLVLAGVGGYAIQSIAALLAYQHTP